MKTRIDSIVLCPGAPDKEALSFIEDACLHIQDGEILYAGPRAQAPAFEADQRIDGKGNLAVPGLANTHTHIAMTLLRGFGGGLNLQDWLEKKVFPAEDRLTCAFARAGAMLGMAEMLRFGVTACSDMYFFMDETAEAAALSGIRLVLSRATLGNEEDDGGRLAEGE
ncbi:MAG TPA: amidohydrolase family protein, partial [Clostridia bacterium]|nr:amidohydrolase family protein [Clostridia bacterium]